MNSFHKNTRYMSHEFSDNPIKLHIIDLKTAELTKTYVFIGKVSAQLERDLISVQNQYNKLGRVKSTPSSIRNFYGANWQTKLGLGMGTKKGGGDDDQDPLEALNDYLQDITGSCDQSDEAETGNKQTGNNDIETGNKETGNNDTKGGKDNPFEIDEALMKELDQTLLGDELIKDNESVSTSPEETKDIIEKDKSQAAEKKKARLEARLLTAEDIDEGGLTPRKELNILDINVGPKAAVEVNNRIEFVFDKVSIYPIDKISDFKLKIYLTTGIPIYRQHLWFRYKNKSYPMSYNILRYGNYEYIDIEYLFEFYKNAAKEDKIAKKDKNAAKEDKIAKKDKNAAKGDKDKKDKVNKKEDKNEVLKQIEGIYIDTNYYNSKKDMLIEALDNFNLLQTYYHIYGNTNYYLIDFNSVMSKKTNELLLKDRYQMELVYYGFIALYFPIITLPVFVDYLKNEKVISEIYPDIYPSRSSVETRLNMESDIVDEIYELYDSPKDYKKISSHVFSSITETILSINNYKQDQENVIVLRNLFDSIVLDDKFVYCKCHILHNAQNIILHKAYMNERSPKESIPMNSLMLKIRINEDTDENLRFVIFQNGNYVVKSNWREESHMNFDDITNIAIKQINPIIDFINKIGATVKYIPKDITPIVKNNVIYTETNMTFYYDRDLTESNFDTIKKIIADYKKANILNSKETDITGTEYFFSKGMYRYDVSRIEKSIVLDNYYEYLTSGTVKQKWNTIFDKTRSLQIINISSKLKISISGIRDNLEMEIFYMFLLGMIKIYEKNAKIKKHSSSRANSETINTKTRNALKNLKLQDPLLYDYKKIYKGNVVYSRLCQRPYLPLLLSDEEYASLSKDRKEKAVRYWNFTKNSPVWYSCPNPRFPYIKYIIKKHPKDFCMPCCKKVPMGDNVNQKKQEIHSTCEKTHIYTGEKINLTKGSHYISTYGKDIEPGRISRLPEDTLESLFFDTYSPEGSIDQECVTSDGYYLYGIEQNLENIPNVGYVFCLAHAMERTVPELAEECAARLKNKKGQFDALLDGQIKLYFSTPDDLIAAIYDITGTRGIKMATGKSKVRPKGADKEKLFSNGTGISEKSGRISLRSNGVSQTPWNEIFMSLAYYYLGINTILFDDQQRETIDLVLKQGIKSVDQMFPTTHKNIIILRRKKRYYPTYLLNTETYKRTGIIEARLFLNESGIITIIKAVVRNYLNNNEVAPSGGQIIDILILNKFLSSPYGSEYKISAYFINSSNICYAVLIEHKSGKSEAKHVLNGLKFTGHENFVYFPIYESIYSAKLNNLIFDNFSTKKYQTKFSDLVKFIKAYNRWAGHQNMTVTKTVTKNVLVPEITVDRWLAIRDKYKGGDEREESGKEEVESEVIGDEVIGDEKSKDKENEESGNSEYINEEKEENESKEDKVEGGARRTVTHAIGNHIRPKLVNNTTNKLTGVVSEKLLRKKYADVSVIGFAFGNMNYYFSAIDLNTAFKMDVAAVNLMLYHPEKINGMISRYKNNVAARQNISTTFNIKLHKSLYKYYIYQLVVLEYINIFNYQKNDALRRKLYSIIVKTDFGKDTTQIKEFIDNIEDVEDQNKLRSIISKFMASDQNKKLLVDNIKQSFFNFDKILLEKLKRMNKEVVKKQLHNLAARFVKFGNIEKEKEFSFPNILVSCSKNKNGTINYCSGNKLIIEKNKLDEIIDVLASDIINPLKWKWIFNSMFVDKSINFFKFARRPQENISIEFL